MKFHPIKGTPFFCTWGGRFVEGQLKWIISSEDEDMLEMLLSDIDQLWVSKEEATYMAKDWFTQFQQGKKYTY